MRAMLVVMLVACGKSGATDVCKRAAVKFEGCIKELLGPEMAAGLKDKQGIEACAADDKTVAMYRTCLDKPCDQFLDCMEGQVRASLPVVPKDLPRKAQCEQHVKDGLRSIAMQTIMLDEIEKRDEAGKATAQQCVIDETKPWASCITAAERADVERYGKQRQKDCEKWDAAIAACAFHQDPKCDPDMIVPGWREPREDALPGPAVAWQIDGIDANSITSPLLAWLPDHALVIGDAKGVRLVRDGKVAWHADGELRHPALAGRYAIAAEGGDDKSGLRIIDVKTGATTNAIAKRYVGAFGAAGDKIFALAGSDLYEVTPSACAKPSCAKKLGTFPDDDSFSTETLVPWRDKLVQLSSTDLRIVDKKANVVFELAQSNDEAAIALAGDTLAVTDSKGVALASLTKCAASGGKLELASMLDLPGECTLAAKPKHRMLGVHPVMLSGGVLAFNDDDVIAKTALVTPSGGGWEMTTDGIGSLVADERFVYTVTNGPEGVRVLALERASGKAAWATVLLPKAPDTLETGLAVGNDMLAVRINGVVYAIALASRPA